MTISGKFYESKLSPFHRVFVSPSSRELELISLDFQGFNTVLIAIMLGIVTTILLVIAITVYCR